MATTLRITNAKASFIKSLCVTLNKPVPNLEIYNNEMASNLIEALRKEVAKNKDFYASKQQMDTIKDMRKCPYIDKCFSEELGLIPNNWIQALKKLKDEYTFYNEVSKTGYARHKLCKAGELEEVADFLFSNGIINEQTHENLIWYRELLSLVLEKNKLVEIDGFIYQRKIINKVYIESKQKQVRERIETARLKIEERTNNPYLYLPKDEVTRFISAHTKEYKSWITNRLSDEQYKYLTELHRRVNGTSENMEGYKMLSKKQASGVIKQLEREQGYVYAINSEVEKSFVSYTGEEYTSEKNVAWEYENNKAWSNMLFVFNRFIGYKPEVEVNDYIMVKELINLAVMMGAPKEEVNDVLINSYNWSVDELDELELRLTSTIVNEINKDKEDALNKVKQLLELGYISQEELKGLIA